MVSYSDQIVVAVNQLAVAEGLMFCQKSGVDPTVMLEAIGGGAAGSWQLNTLGPRIAARDFARAIAGLEDEA
mgnify:CR=1 FL=1